MTWIFFLTLNVVSWPLTHEWGQREREREKTREGEKKEQTTNLGVMQLKTDKCNFIHLGRCVKSTALNIPHDSP